MIDKRADIHPSAKLADDVIVGPWAIIGADVEIASGTEIGPHVFIKGPTKIGKNNKIFQFASIGEDPQDLKYAGERTELEIGDHNTIREFCTINRGTVQGGSMTRIGSHNLLMSYVHIAHDCMVGNHVIFANNAALAGHVIVKDYANLSAFSAVVQFRTVGSYSFLAKGTMVSKDVLPYVLIIGYDARTCGLNTVGLERHGFSKETINMLQTAYKIIFRQNLTTERALEKLYELVEECPEVHLLIEGIKASEHGIVR